MGSEIIIVVEKDASFQRIVQDYEYLRNIIGEFIIVTGKGYPCLSTREFLCLIESKHPEAHFFGIFDYDPYGLDILSVYKYGSRSLSWFKMGLKNIVWIGIRSQSILKYNIDKESFIPLNSIDMRKANSLLNLFLSIDETELQQEIEFMIHFGHKLEIEGIESLGNLVITRTFIPEQICGYVFGKCA